MKTLIDMATYAATMGPSVYRLRYWDIKNDKMGRNGTTEPWHYILFHKVGTVVSAVQLGFHCGYSNADRALMRVVRISIRYNQKKNKCSYHFMEVPTRAPINKKGIALIEHVWYNFPIKVQRAFLEEARNEMKVYQRKVK